MIEAITVERFRGLKHLEVEGFGRANLILGKNNRGKTALMEALAIGREPAGAGRAVLFCQRERNPGVAPSDFERSWRPLFWKQDADQGLALKVRLADGQRMSVELRKSQASSLLIEDNVAPGAFSRAS